MSTNAITRPARGAYNPAFENGDRMTQDEFHRLYEQTPPGFRAELIGGVVHVPSPLKYTRGRKHSAFGFALSYYETETPGVEAADNVTVILGDDDEPQPDLLLRVAPEYGGRTVVNESGYVEGPPELIAEVANSSRAIDLYEKRERYAATGVIEYVVADIRDRRIHHFDLRTNEPVVPEADGLTRSFYFPGLWIHPAALFSNDTRAMRVALDAGLATPEHAAFVARLAAAKKP
ncbi:MAG: Uma2 family endonuclease [Fimbriiglobus sp.]